MAFIVMMMIVYIIFTPLQHGSWHIQVIGSFQMIFEEFHLHLTLMESIHLVTTKSVTQRGLLF